MHIKTKKTGGTMALIKINNDCFEISRRLREIEPNYFIVFNTLTQKFEVHNSGQYLNTFCLTIDGEIDCRVIEKVLKTRAQNIEKLLREIEEHNEKLENDKTRKTKDELHARSCEVFDYLKSNDDLTGAYSTRFV